MNESHELTQRLREYLNDLEESSAPPLTTLDPFLHEEDLWDSTEDEEDGGDNEERKSTPSLVRKAEATQSACGLDIESQNQAKSLTLSARAGSEPYLNSVLFVKYFDSEVLLPVCHLSTVSS